MFYGIDFNFNEKNNVACEQRYAHDDIKSIIIRKKTIGFHLDSAIKLSHGKTIFNGL